MGLLLNRAKANTTTTGTGAVTPGSAVSPYQSWSAAGATAGASYDYLIEDGTAWEVGVGMYNGTTITRPGPGVDSSFASSTGSLISLSGSATIACVTNKNSSRSLYPLIAPPSLATWVNQGTATTTVQSDGTLSVSGALDSSENVRGVFMSLPAPPWHYRIGFVHHLSFVNWQHCGIALRESSTGKLVLFGAYLDTTQALFLIANFNSPTSKNANVVALNRSNGSGPIYLNIQDDGTNRKATFGYDQYAQKLAAYSVTRTSFITPDQIGIYIDNTNTTNPLDISVFSWASI